MTKKHTSKTERSIFLSLISTVLCVAMLAGLTFAWFTMNVESDTNIITTAPFDAQIFWSTSPDAPASSQDAAASDAWHTLNETGFDKPFSDDTYLPGSETVRYIVFYNNCDYPVKFDVSLKNISTAGGIENVLDVYVKDDASFDSALTTDSMTKLNDLSSLRGIASNGLTQISSSVVAGETKKVIAVGVKLPETFEPVDPTQPLQASFIVKVIATQYNVAHETATVTVTSANDSQDLTLRATNAVSVVVPASATEENDVYNLSVIEEGTTTSIQTGTTTIDYDITLTKNDNVITSDGTNYTIIIDIGTGKDVAAVKHKGIDVAFDYNSTTGILTFTTDSFSPFSVTYRLPALLITKAGEEDIDMNLADFAASVNAGNTYAGYTVTLQRDIDLNGVEWTPIGTTAHPFSGIFDGNNHTISNLTYNGAPTGQMLGLFGEVKGTKNANAMALADVWNDGNFVEESFNESNYTAVIKNLTLNKFNITNTSISGSTRYTGALAGRTDDVYISNVTVSNSAISGTKGVGGLVGSFNGSTAISCKTLANVTVTSNADGYNVGGLFGGTNYSNHDTQTNYGAIVDCENNAAVTIQSDGANNGFIGGIVGMSQNFVAGDSTSASGYIFVNCVNNGKVEAKNGGFPSVGGIAGFGQNAVAFVGCNNTGAIIAVNADSITGISFGGNGTYNCTNSGNITASANSMAGVYIDYEAQSGSTGLAYGCTNTGVLTNSNASGKTAQVAIVGSIFTIKNETYADVNAVSEAIRNNGSRVYEFVDCTVTDISGTLDLTGISAIISSNTQLCTTVNVTNRDVSLIIPGVEVNVPTGSSDLTLSSMGAGCSVTIASGATVKGVTIGGNNSTLAVNGTVSGKLSFAGEGNVTATINSGATVDTVGFNGTGIYVLNNYGTISHKTASQHANQHTVCTIKAATITVNNYGTIEAKTGDNGICSYAMLFYNGCNVVVNQYPDSAIIADKNGYQLACSTANSVVYNTYDTQGNVISSVTKK